MSSQCKSKNINCFLCISFSLLLTLTPYLTNHHHHHHHHQNVTLSLSLPSFIYPSLPLPLLYLFVRRSAGILINTLNLPLRKVIGKLRAYFDPLLKYRVTCGRGMLVNIQRYQTMQILVRSTRSLCRHPAMPRQRSQLGQSHLIK